MLTASEIVSIRECILDIEEYHDLDDYQERAVQDVLELLTELTPIDTETFVNFIEENNMTEETQAEVEAPVEVQEAPNYDKELDAYREILVEQGGEAAEEYLKATFKDVVPAELVKMIDELLINR